MLMPLNFNYRYMSSMFAHSVFFIILRMCIYIVPCIVLHLSRHSGERERETERQREREREVFNRPRIRMYNKVSFKNLFIN